MVKTFSRLHFNSKTSEKIEPAAAGEDDGPAYRRQNTMRTLSVFRQGKEKRSHGGCSLNVYDVSSKSEKTEAHSARMSALSRATRLSRAYDPV